MRRGIPRWDCSAGVSKSMEARLVIWFFENWLNIARYMADARVQILPLVGGGEHDWTNIFGRWGVLAHDTQIASVVRTIGWTGMGIACLWVLWRWWQQLKAPKLETNVKGSAAMIMDR